MAACAPCRLALRAPRGPLRAVRRRPVRSAPLPGPHRLRASSRIASATRLLSARPRPLRLRRPVRIRARGRCRPDSSYTVRECKNAGISQSPTMCYETVRGRSDALTRAGRRGGGAAGKRRSEGRGEDAGCGADAERAGQRRRRKEPPDGPSRAASAPAADAPVRAQAARPRRATPRTDGPHGTARATGRFGEAESPGAKPFPIAGGTARGPGGRDGIARRRERRPPARGRATGARETARSAGPARGPAIGNRVLGADPRGAEPGRSSRTGRGDAPRNGRGVARGGARG